MQKIVFKETYFIQDAKHQTSVQKTQVNKTIMDIAKERRLNSYAKEELKLVVK